MKILSKALSLVSREINAVRITPAYQADAPFRNFRLLGGTNFDYAREAGRIYDNAVVLPCINFKANALTEMTPVIQEEAKDGRWVTKPKSPEVARYMKALKRPNPYYNWYVLMRASQLSWDVFGNVFWLKRRNAAGQVIGYWYIPNHMISVGSDKDNDGTKLVTHYILKISGREDQDIPEENIVHIRNGIDPEDFRVGLSGLMGALRDVCSENEVSNWFASLVRNEAAPSTIFTPKSNTGMPASAVGIDVVKEAQKYLNNFIRDRRGEIAITPVAFDMLKPSWSPKDLDLGPARDVPVSRICAGLGVDPMIIALINDRGTFANMATAIDSFGKRTMLPQARDWADQITQQTLEDFGIDSFNNRLCLSAQGVTWLIDETNETHKNLRENWKAGGIDLYEFRSGLGYDVDETMKGVYFADTIKEDAPQNNPNVPETNPTKVNASRGLGGLLEAVPSGQSDHDRIIKEGYKEMQVVFNKWKKSEITKDEALLVLEQIIADMHGKQLNLSGITDAEFVKFITAHHVEYLQEFLKDVQAGKYARGGEDLFDDEADDMWARLKLYAYNTSGTATVGQLRSKPDVQAKWVTTASESCIDCLYMASLGYIDVANLFTVPRMGDTRCNGNCECYLRYSDNATSYRRPTI